MRFESLWWEPLSSDVSVLASRRIAGISSPNVSVLASIKTAPGREEDAWRRSMPSQHSSNVIVEGHGGDSLVTTVKAPPPLTTDDDDDDDDDDDNDDDDGAMGRGGNNGSVQ